MQVKAVSKKRTDDKSTAGIDVSQEWLDVHVLPAGQSLGIRDEDRPVLFVAEERARRHLQYVLTAPDDCPGLEPKPVAELVGDRRDDVANDINSLLLYAEGRHLGKRSRLD